MRRVVITGLGAVTPFGTDVAALWKGLLEGRSAVGPLRSFDPERLPSRVAGECVDFDPEAFLGRAEARRLDRSTQMALVAARQAWEEAAPGPSLDRDRAGVIFASGIGGITSLLDSHLVLRERGPDRISPYTVPRIIPNAAAGQIAMAYGLRGPNFCPVTACAASNHALGLAWHSIRSGEADLILAGGTESAITELTVGAFSRMGALSTGFNDRPEAACRPFDARRDGFVIAEGSGALVLEDLDSARRRGATVYGEIVGFGQSADAFHITAPAEDGGGAALAMERALRSGNLEPVEVGYINAHATSTPLGDVAETRAIKKVFGDLAHRVAVSSTKSAMGHLTGAAGAVEGIATVLALRDGILPPTLNQEEPDPECDLDYIPNEARPAQVEVALSNGFGFGGHNAVVAFRRFED